MLAVFTVLRPKHSHTLLRPFVFHQGDRVREGQPHDQRELGYRLRTDADEGARTRRHDGAQRHPVPETRDRNAHSERGRVVLRGRTDSEKMEEDVFLRDN